jgi:hypothetical protein
MRADRNYGTQGVYQVGSIMPQEHGPTRYEGTLAVDRFLVRRAVIGQMARSIRDQLKSLPEGNAAEGTPVDDEQLIMNLEVLDVIVEDKYSGQVLRSYIGCSLMRYSENITANALAGEDATFTYLNCLDG